ncbi:MAG: hypothetical protein AABZ31_03600 [Bdellovibrionota bacterium]
MQSQTAFNDEDGSFKKIDPEKIFCEVDPMDYDLKVRFIGFEMTSDSKVTFGFILGKFFKAFDIKFRLLTGQATLALDLAKTLNPGKDIVNVLGYGTFLESEVGIDVDMGDLDAGFEHYSKTPLSRLAGRALDDGLKNLNKDLKDSDVAWRSRITGFLGKDGDLVSMPAGLQAGVKEGDKFKIYNVTHDWADPSRPCASEHRGSPPTTSTPIAYGVVEDASTFYSYLKITKMQDVAIQLGARIEVEKLKGSGRKLKRGVRLREVSTGAIAVENQTMNLIPYLEAQLKPKVRDSGFYLSK